VDTDSSPYQLTPHCYIATEDIATEDIAPSMNKDFGLCNPPIRRTDTATIVTNKDKSILGVIAPRAPVQDDLIKLIDHFPPAKREEPSDETWGSLLQRRSTPSKVKKDKACQVAEVASCLMRRRSKLGGRGKGWCIACISAGRTRCGLCICYAPHITWAVGEGDGCRVG
jgi:hypothetical protein